MKNTRSLLRGLSVIEALAGSQGGMGPTQLAQSTNLDKGTVTRLLYTLIEASYVRRDPETRRYALTPRILHIAEGVQTQLDLRHLARPHLRKLRDAVRETVHLGILDHDKIVYVEKLQPPTQSVQLITGVGQTMPVHSTALGKAILSRTEASRLDEIVGRLTFHKQTEKTIGSAPELFKALESVRAKGFAVDDEENMDGVSCVAAPLIDAKGLVTGAVSISSPTFRVAGRLEDLGQLLLETTAAISADLGAEESAPPTSTPSRSDRIAHRRDDDDGALHEVLPVRSEIDRVEAVDQSE